MGKNRKLFLICTTFLVGLCSIIYELLVSTATSYFLGNSVRQFSLIIGFYMAAMGVGSFLSRLFTKNLLYNFIIIEIVLGLVGAFSVPLLYIYFAYADYSGFNIFSLFLISIIGILTGLEIPLITRIMEMDFSLKDNISNILTFDYLGALIATLIFPFVLVPLMGIYKSSLLFGLINIAVGLANYIFFRDILNLTQKSKRVAQVLFVSFSLVITLAFFLSQEFMKKWNDTIFKQSVIYTKQTPYQEINFTQNDYEFRLYLNGVIQFSSRDEHRYHEGLIHVPLMQCPQVKNVLVLGGGEGLAAREILKYPEVEKIIVVDIDPAITDLAKNFNKLVIQNDSAFFDQRVEVRNQDAFTYLMETDLKFDAVICDLPDPSSDVLCRLYSNAFYKLIDQKLSPNGIVATQASSPDLTTAAFWCINETLKVSGFEHTYPYNINVPSFGNWGFIMASHRPLTPSFKGNIPTRFLSAESFSSIFQFPKDLIRSNILPNYLDQPILIDYYLDSWRMLAKFKK